MAKSSEGKRKEKKIRSPEKADAAQQPSTPADIEVPAVNKAAISVIAKPLAEDKLLKKVLKLVKRGAKRKQIKRGVKEVVKALRKNTQGICIIAGDISPLDVVTHIPVMCEDRDTPYVYVPSKEALGAAGMTKRPTSCMLVLPKPPKGGADDDEAKEFASSYDEIAKRVKAIQPVF